MYLYFIGLDSQVMATDNYTGYSSWRHQMETFSALLAICAGNSPAPGEFPTQRPVTRSFRQAGDLRRYRAHYDVTLMCGQDNAMALQWYHNERDGVSHHRRRDCLLKHFVQAQINENIEWKHFPRHWPMWGESTGHR